MFHGTYTILAAVIIERNLMMKIGRWLFAISIATLSTLAYATPSLYGVTTGMSFDAAKRSLAFCDGCRVEFNERPKYVSHYAVYLNYKKEFYSNTSSHGINFNRPWEAVFVTVSKQGRVVNVLNQIHTDEATADKFIAQTAKESGVALTSINESLEGLPAQTLISDGRKATQFLSSDSASGKQFRISKVRARSGLYLVSASYTDFDLYQSEVASSLPQEVSENDKSYVLAKLANDKPTYLNFTSQVQNPYGIISIANDGSSISLAGNVVHNDDYEITGIAQIPGLQDRYILNIRSGGNSCAGNMSKMLSVINGKVTVSEEFGFCGPPALYNAEQFDSTFVMMFENENPEYDDKQLFIMR